MIVKPKSGFGNWAIDSQEWDEILKICEKYNVQSVVEFGQGMSTYLFKQIAKKYAAYEIHDSSIHTDTYVIRRDLKYPVMPQMVRKDMEPIIGSGKFDLAFVDSPQGRFLHNGCSRLFSATAAKMLSNMVLMHDTKRPGEQKTIDALFGDSHRIELPSGRGLTLFIKRKGGDVVTPRKRHKKTRI